MRMTQTYLIYLDIRTHESYNCFIKQDNVSVFQTKSKCHTIYMYTYLTAECSRRCIVYKVSNFVKYLALIELIFKTRPRTPTRAINDLVKQKKVCLAQSFHGCILFSTILPR